MQEDNENIAKMLRELPRISAPSGFDESVRARILDHSAKTGRRRIESAWPLAIKFGLPAAALVLIAVYLFLPQMPDKLAVQPIADQQANIIAGVPENQTFNSSAGQSVTQRDTALQSERALMENRRSVGDSGQPARKDTPGGGGSIDSAISQANPPVMPPGLQAAPLAPASDNTAVSGRGIRINEILAMLGISADCGSRACDVRSVAAGSFAAGAGLVAGDRIVAVDSYPVSSDFDAKRAVTVRTLTVLRDGRKLDLSLRLPQ